MQRIDIKREALIESLNKVPAPEPNVITNREDIGKKYRGFSGLLAKAKDWGYSIVLKPDQFFDWLDSGKTKYDGPFVRFFVDDMNKKINEARENTNKRVKWVNDELKKLGFKISDFAKIATNIDGKNYTWKEIHEIYLGMRNEKKAQAIIFGNFVSSGKYTEEQARNIIAKLLNMMDEKQKIAADLIIQDHNMNFDRLNNKLIEAFNKGMEQEKDYTSIHRLEYLSQGGLINADMAEALERNNKSEADILRTVETGFMLSRQEISNKNQKAIKLDAWGNWLQDISRHEYSAAMALTARELMTTLLQKNNDGKSVMQMIKERFGNDAWHTLVSFFNDSVTDEQRLAYDFLNGASGYLTKARSIAHICWNFSVYLMQTTSYPLFVSLANPIYMFNSLAKFSANPAGFLEHVYNLNPQLRNTGGSPEINAIKQNPYWGSRIYQKILDLGFTPVTLMDRWTKAIGWQAVYDSNVKRVGHENAIREANRAVRITQPASTTNEQGRLWRSGGAMKVIMQFTSATASIFDMTVYDLVQQISSKDFNSTKKALSTITALSLTAIITKLLKDGLPNGDNPDDDNGLGGWLLDSFSQQFFETIPLIGKEAMMLWDEIVRNKHHQYQYSAVLTPFVKIAKAWRLWNEPDSDDEKIIQAAMFALEGLALEGLPFPITAFRRVIQSLNLAGEDNLAAALNIFGIRKGED